MKKRIATCLFCIAVAGVVGCPAGTTIHKNIGSPCKAAPSKVYVRDGVRFLVVQLPDGQSVVIRLDGLPEPPTPTPSLIPKALKNCPCEDDDCRPMCLTLPPDTEKDPVQTCPAP
jgi:hypothetical protein